MGHYIARRLIYLAVVLLVVSAITFILMHAVPGGPFDQEKRVPPEILANLNRRYHLDEPLPVQYARYLYDVILPHFTTNPPKNTVDNDFLINFQIGAAVGAMDELRSDVFIPQPDGERYFPAAAARLHAAWHPGAVPGDSRRYSAGDHGSPQTEYPLRLPGYEPGNFRSVRAGDCAGSSAGVDFWQWR